MPTTPSFGGAGSGFVSPFGNVQGVTQVSGFGASTNTGQGTASSQQQAKPKALQTMPSKIQTVEQPSKSINAISGSNMFLSPSPIKEMTMPTANENEQVAKNAQVLNQIQRALQLSPLTDQTTPATLQTLPELTGMPARQKPIYM